jgi:hypothetical protein
MKTRFTKTSPQRAAMSSLRWWKFPVRFGGRSVLSALAKWGLSTNSFAQWPRPWPRESRPTWEIPFQQVTLRGLVKVPKHGPHYLDF